MVGHSLLQWTTFVTYSQPRQHIKKQRHHYANKGPSSQGYAFSNSHVLMWELDHKESWVLKNWCFSTVVLEKTRVLLYAKRSKQSILKEIRPEYSLEGLMLELKLQYFSHLMHWLIGKDPDAGKDWRQKEKGVTEDRWLDASPTQWTWVWVGSGSWWWTGKPGVLQSMGSQRVRHDWVTELNWTDAKWRPWFDKRTQESSFMFHDCLTESQCS